MSTQHYICPDCDQELSYETTKHDGCPECGFVPAHSAD
jgi:DNA-directed RNA polymerase subunit RPC12/RpoP